MDTKARLIFEAEISNAKAGIAALRQEVAKGNTTIQQAAKGIKGYEQRIRDAGKVAGTSTSAFGGLFKQFTAGALAATAITKGVSLLTDTIKESIEVAAKKEQVALRLTNALKHEGYEATTLAPKFKALADQLELLTGVSDDLIMTGFARMIRSGISVKDVYKDMQFVIDASIEKEKDLNSVIDLFIKASAGKEGALERLAAEFGIATTKADTFETIIKKITDVVGGAAQENMTEYTRALIKYNETMEDLQVTAGTKLLPVLTSVAEAMATIFTMSKMGWGKVGFGFLIGGVSGAAGAIGEQMVGEADKYYKELVKLSQSAKTNFITAEVELDQAITEYNETMSKFGMPKMTKANFDKILMENQDFLNAQKSNFKKFAEAVVKITDMDILFPGKFEFEESLSKVYAAFKTYGDRFKELKTAQSEELIEKEKKDKADRDRILADKEKSEKFASEEGLKILKEALVLEDGETEKHYMKLLIFETEYQKRKKELEEEGAKKSIDVSGMLGLLEMNYDKAREQESLEYYASQNQMRDTYFQDQLDAHMQEFEEDKKARQQLYDQAKAHWEEITTLGFTGQEAGMILHREWLVKQLQDRMDYYDQLLSLYEKDSADYQRIQKDKESAEKKLKKLGVDFGEAKDDTEQIFNDLTNAANAAGIIAGAFKQGEMSTGQILAMMLRITALFVGGPAGGFLGSLAGVFGMFDNPINDEGLRQRMARESSRVAQFTAEGIARSYRSSAQRAATLPASGPVNIRDINIFVQGAPDPKETAKQTKNELLRMIRNKELPLETTNKKKAH